MEFLKNSKIWKFKNLKIQKNSAEDIKKRKENGISISIQNRTENVEIAK